MLNAVIALSVKFRILVVGATVVLLAVAIPQLRTAAVDEYPEFAPPQVEVQAEALGLSAAEVEQLITVPLEQDLLNGVPWLEQIRSESVPGLSTIDLTFNSGTDLLKARQMVQEHLTQAHALPQVGTPPVMIQPTSSTGRVLMVALRADQLSLVDLSILARWKVKPRLEGLPGVANVAIWGQRDRQLQVQVDPAKLRANGVSLNQVVSTTGNALWVSPLTFVEASTPGTGGFVDTTNQRFGIQHVTPITTAEGLSAVTVEDTTGRTLRLGQVADVVEDHQPLIGDAVLDGSPGLMLVIQKFPGANTREVTAAVEQALDEMKPGLSGVTMDTTVYRPASYLDDALGNLAVRGLIGLLLVVILLVGFLLSWRAAVVALASMLTSLLAAAYLLQLRATTFNVLVLAGLLAASAVVVADSIADVYALRRRPAAARASTVPSNGHPVHGYPVDGTTNGHSMVDGHSTVDGHSAVDGLGPATASRTVRAPLVYAALIMLLLPVPALLVGGVPGRLIRPAVLSYALAIAVSMAGGPAADPGAGLLPAGPRAPAAESAGRPGRARPRRRPAPVAAPAAGAAGHLGGAGAGKPGGAAAALPRPRDAAHPARPGTDRAPAGGGRHLAAGDDPADRPGRRRIAHGARGERRRCACRAGADGRPVGERRLRGTLDRRAQHRPTTAAPSRRCARSRRATPASRPGSRPTPPTGCRRPGSERALRCWCGCTARTSTSWRTPPSRYAGC